MRIKILTGAAILLIFLAQPPAFALISESKLNKIRIGMTAEQIVSSLGEPELRRAEGEDGLGRKMERLQYTLTRRLRDPLPNGDMEAKIPCSLMLAAGALVRIEREQAL